MVERQLPSGDDLDTQFRPRYDPWGQRLCVVPDGDLLDAIAEGRASMVTDCIDILSLRFGAIEDGAIEFSRTSSDLAAAVVDGYRPLPRHHKRLPSPSWRTLGSKASVGFDGSQPPGDKLQAAEP